MKQTAFLYLFLLLAVGGCTEVIDLNLNDDKNQRLVVDGCITNEIKAHTVRLTKTANYFSKDLTPKVTGAIVTITEGGTTYSLSETSPGVYQTAATVAGKIGKTYTLKIITDGEEYTASSYLDSVPPLDSISYEPPKSPDEEYTILMNTQEIPGPGNHYVWKMLKNDTLQTDTLRELAFTDDLLVDGNYISNWEVYGVKAKTGDKIKLEMYSITKNNYNYFLALMLETDWKGGPFDAPPANVPGNISNGAVGFFGASAVSSKEVIIK